ncbi:MAG: ferritin-like domain-containing protein [Anaerolineae bacterium]
MKLNSLRDLLIENLQDLHSAETQITKALPKMADAATNPSLKQAFETHLQQTNQQVDRLERILERMGHKSRGKKCKGMEGLLAEGSEIMEENAASEVMDAALIGAAQKVEHYEISGYGTAVAYAQLLGESEAVTLLQQTLSEEEQTDSRLSALAEGNINETAANRSDKMR